MTKLQKKVHTYMLNFKKKHGYSPGMLTIANALKKKKEDIAQVFRSLKQQGRIVKQTSVQIGHYEAVENSVDGI